MLLLLNGVVLELLDGSSASLQGEGLEYSTCAMGVTTQCVSATHRRNTSCRTSCPGCVLLLSRTVLLSTTVVVARHRVVCCVFCFHGDNLREFVHSEEVDVPDV